MIPSKNLESRNVSRRSKPRSESRRSSILKPCKPRQPLQNVKLDSSSSNENSPATSKVKRRVSFAEKKHVKEFSASNEQGTVWVSTYEEHDSILKESFIVDQNTKTESKENIPEYTSKNGNTYINFENSSSYPNNSNLASNCLCEPLIKTNEEDNNTSCDMDLTNQSELEKIVLPDAYFVSNISKNATSNGIVEYSDTDEEYIELSNKQSQLELTSNATSSRIIIYKDSDEEDHASNINNKYCSNSYSNNVNTKLDNICIQDISMKLTTVIPTSLHLSAKEEKDVQKDNILHPDNLHTNYTTKCNNISMEMTQPILMPVKPTSFYSGIFEQISTLAQNHEHIEYSAANNNTFLTNSQSNIVPKNIVSEQMLNTNHTINSVILSRPFTTGTNMCCANNITFNASIEMTNATPSKTYERNIPHSYNENCVKGNNLREDQNDKTEFFNDAVMEMTRPINALSSNVYDKENLKVNEPIFRDDKTMIFPNISMEMPKTVSARNRQEITDAITCKSSSKENACERKDANNSTCFNERTKLLHKSMEITEAVPVSSYHEKTFNTAHVAQSAKKNTTDRTEFFNNCPTKMMEPINVLSSNIYDNENLRTNEPVSRNDRTTIFHNISMEMTKTVSARNRQEITDAITCKSSSEGNTYERKDANNSTCFNERTKLLHKSMEITEAVPVSSYHEKTFNTAHVAQSAKKNTTDRTEFFNNCPTKMMEPINVLSSNIYDNENLRTNEPVSRDDRTTIFHNISMEMTKTVSARNRQEIIDAIACKSSSEENACERKDANNSTCFNERTKLLHKSMEITEAVPVSLYHEKTFNTAHVAQSAKKNTTDRTEFFNNCPTKMMEPINVLSSNIYDNENLRTNEPVSRDDRTTIFHNISMEMTKTVSARNRQEIIDAIACKSSSEENACERKDANNSTCFNERTKLLHKSMEITEVVPVSSYHEKTFNTAHVAQSAKKNTTDRTEFFNNCPAKMMEPINILSSNIYDNENLRTNEPMSRDDRTTIFHNIPMEITKTVSARNRQEITDTITCKSLSEENVSSRKDANNSIYFNEETRLLHKSMGITEAVPVSLYHSRTFNTTSAAQSTSFSQTISKVHSPIKTSTESILQTNAAVNNAIQNVSMEITAAIPLTLHVTEDMIINDNKLIVFEGNEFQHRTTNNLTASKKNVTKETCIISRKSVETANMNNELSNVFIIPSSSDGPDHSLSAILQNISSRKRMSDENVKTSPKRVRSSFMESQTSPKNNIHLSLKVNDHCVNDNEHNEHFVKDTIDHTQIPESNFEDSINGSSECSFLRKSLPYLSQNSSAELQSIKPPSFKCLDSEEVNSIHSALCKNEYQRLTIDDVVLITKHNNYNRLTTNDITESECLTKSKKNTTEDYENFKISREKEESINIENNQTEDCYKNTIANKIEGNQKVDCDVITKTFIEDNRINESNCYTTDVDNLNTENISTINAKDKKTATLPIIKKTEIIYEKKYTQKRINDDAKLWNNVEKKDQYSDVEKRLDAVQCNDHFKKTEVVIEEQIDPEERCKDNLNDEIKLQSMEQKQIYVEEKFEAEQCISAIKDKSLSEQDPFLSLLQRLKTYAEREDCIWNVYHKNYDKKMIVFGFMSNSLLIVMFLSDNLNCSEENLKKVKIISRVSDDACVLVRIVHKLILEKINAEILTNLCRIHKDVFSMLNFVSQDVKLAMDFMFDLKHLDDLNLMEIANNEISFVSRSKRMGVILRVTIKVKRFDKLTSNDINVCCLLGTIREMDVKNLIRNVKKDYKFLRRYMNDVKDYVDIMEGTFK